MATNRYNDRNHVPRLDGSASKPQSWGGDYQRDLFPAELLRERARQALKVHPVVREWAQAILKGPDSVDAFLAKRMKPLLD